MLLNKKLKNHTTAKAKFILCFCSAFFTSQFIAQTVRLDSINLDPAEKELHITNPEIAFDNRIFFSDAYLFFKNNDLNFKRVQAPENSSLYGFGAKGIFKFNPKIVLSGKLQVSNENEKKVSYILTDERTTDQNYISNPSYFYVPRKSDWIKQNYQISGNLAYKVLKNVIFVGNVEGEFQKSYGSSDPRPEIGNFNYRTNAKLGYQVGKHRLFAKGGYFNRKKESNIIYTVNELSAPNYFDTYIRVNKGYGNYYFNTGYGSVFYQYDGTSYGAEYQYFGKKNFLKLSYQNEYFIDRMHRNFSYQTRDEENVLRTYYDRMKMTGLKTDKNIFSADYLGNLGSFKWNSSLKLVDQKDINYDYINFYTSYRALNTTANFTNIFTKYNSKNEMLRFGAKLNYQDQDIKDVSVVLHKQLTSLQYEIFAEKEYRTAENQKLSLGLSQSLYSPLETNLNYAPYESSQENIFVKNIIQPDYFYDSSNRFSLEMNLKYLVDLKKVRYEISALVNQTFFVGNKQQMNNQINTNENRFLNFGLNIYY